MSLFKNRSDAGKQLAEALETYRNHENTLVLALPRGGVPVAFEVSQELCLPLDIFIVRKLGLPGHEELAMGATASGGIILWNNDVLRMSSVSEAEKQAVINEETQELLRREQVYRKGRGPLTVAGKTIILIDDGVATGATMKVAIQALRTLHPKKLVVAVPLSAKDTLQELKTLCDAIVCLETPEPFSAIGLWYENFPQNSDSEVIDLLKRANHL